VLADYQAPFVVVCGRFFVAAVFLLWFTTASHQFVRIPRHLWWRFAVLGICGIFLHNGLLYKGLEDTTATTASIILALIASQVVILDVLIYRRVPDRLTMAGVLLGFVGTSYVLTAGDLTDLFSLDLGWGEALVFLSALTWAIYSVLGRDILQTYSALVVTTYATLIGLVFLFPFLFEQPTVTLAIYSDTTAVALIFFLGSVGSALGFLWYYQAVVSIGTVGAAMYTNLVPIFGVLCASLVLGEEVDRAVLVGGALVFAGLMLVNRPASVAAPRA